MFGVGKYAKGGPHVKIPDDVMQLMGIGPYRRRTQRTGNRKDSKDVRGGMCGTETEQEGYP